MSPDLRRRQIRLRMALLVLGVLISAALFMTLNARGSWSFVLSFRGTKLAGLALVAIAIALATVVFQTLTRNRILTPSIMGFDAMFVLLQTTLVFVMGADLTSRLDPKLLFAVEVTLLTGFAALLFGWLFGKASRSLHLVLLVGIVFGTLFRSISGLMQRIISPDDFLVLQDRMFASFNAIDPTLLGFSALIIAGVMLALWRLLPVLDVMALGRDHAIGLGVNHDRIVLVLLALVTLLVAISTALVGPVGFFGLLVANLAIMLMPSAKHAVILPAAALISMLFLIGGQTILERLLKYDTALSVVIEFLGGLLFLFLVIRGTAK